MQFIITSFHGIEEAIKKKDFVNAELYCSKSSSRIDKIAKIAQKSDIKVIRANKKEMERATNNIENRGIALVVQGYEKSDQDKTLDDYLQSFTKNKLLILVLDQITDVQNYAAILRSCDLFDVDLVIVPARHSAHSSPTITRISSGADNWLPVCVVTNLVSSLNKLKESGFWVYGAEMDGESLLSEKFSEKTAIVMGSEGEGLGKLVQTTCDKLLSIDTKGHIDSLNVSVAAGVFLYEVRRQHWAKKSR